MNPKKAFFVVALICTQLLQAQSKQDSIFVEKTISELKYYSKNVKDSTTYYINKAISVRDTLKNNLQKHRLTYTIADTYFTLREYQSSINELDKIIKSIDSIEDNCFITDVYSLIGISSSRINKMSEGLIYDNKSLKYAKLCNDYYKIARSLNNICINYEAFGRPEESYKYGLESITVYEKIKNFKNKKERSFGINIYFNAIKNPTIKNEEKLKYLEKATSIANELNDNFSFWKTNSAKAFFYDRKIKDYNLAVTFSKKALFYANKDKNKNLIISSYLELVNSLLKLNNKNETKKYLKELLKHIEKLPDNQKLSLVNAIGQNKNYSNRFSAICFELGLLDEAYKYEVIQNKALRKNIESKYDSISSFYSAKFKSEQKDKEITEHKLTIEKEKQKRFLWIFGAIITAISLISFFYRKQLIGKNKKRLAEELLKNRQKLHAQQTKFIQNIAHEVKTPITIVNGIIETAINNNSTKDLSIALKNTNEINTNVDNILKSLDNNNIDLINNSSPTNIEEFIHQLVTDFSPILNFNKISLTNEYLVDSKYLILLDKEKTQKILSNFLTNALKHSNKNSKIILKTTRKDDNLLFSVTDFGKGIPLEEQEKIFERFYIGKGNQAGGFGIGLSLAKELATFMQGTINVDSTVNKQTTFTLSLPLKFTKTTITESKNNFEHKADFTIPYEKKRKNKPSVLVVDDNLDIINYYKSILDETYNCAYCSNGLEAIKLLKKQSFSLIVSDIMMPKVDGYQFRKLVKELPEYKTIPFIFVTAKTFKADKHFALKLGVDDYITKPFNTNELLLRIENLIKNSKERLKVSNEEVIDGIIEEQKIDPFVEKTIETILDNIENPDFSVSSLADKLNYSQRQFNRIIQKATGFTPVKLILEQRLKQAYMLLNDNINTRVSDVQYKVGINNASYFNKKFKERFGVNPSELIKR